MRFEESIAEMKRHDEARLKQEEYLNKLNNITKDINLFVTPKELRAWRVIEAMICSGARMHKVNEDHIRDLLKGDIK